MNGPDDPARAGRARPASRPTPWRDAAGDFDLFWYLCANPDVRTSGMDPLAHYQRNGRAEGRQGIASAALQLEHRLWRGFAPEALIALDRLVRVGPMRERALAGWVLAGWHAGFNAWDSALKAIRLFLDTPEARAIVPHAGPLLLGIRVASKVGRVDLARDWLADLEDAATHDADRVLARLLVDLAEGRPDTALNATLARLYDTAPLAAVGLEQAQEQGARFDRLRAPGASPERGRMPLVSVIVPVFDGADVLPTALASLCAQTWGALEILVVDDGSRDASRAVARDWAARDSRIRVLEQDRNQGAYAARNTGFAAAQGDFVTVLDADDWAHPQRIARQARALMDRPETMANTSHWVRIGPDLDMTLWRIERTWVFRNVGSLMLRTGLRDALGYWDRVQVNADTEYYHRIMARFGSGALDEVDPGLPLTFGRTLATSLSNSSQRHSRTALHGVRRAYHDAALHWHDTCATDPAALFVPREPGHRPFNVPAALGPSDPPGPPSPFDLIADSAAFDPEWYRRRYEDVLIADINPALHYLQGGAAEDRDPGPGFSTASYRRKQGLSRDENPLLHAIAADAVNLGLPAAQGLFTPREQHADTPRNPGGRIAGKRNETGPEGTIRAPDGRAACVMVFAHRAVAAVLRAERDLLALLSELVGQGIGAIVVLPALPESPLRDRIAALCRRIEVLPILPRHVLRDPHPDNLARTEALFARHRPVAVHVTSAALDAPMRAARAAGLPCHLHLEDLPPPGLGETRAALRAALAAEGAICHTPWVAAADWPVQGATPHIRSPDLDPRLFALHPRLAAHPCVAVIGSLDDAREIALARRLASIVAEAGLRADFTLIGPDTPALAGLSPLGPLLRHGGMAEDAVAALARADIVLDLQDRPWGAKRSTFEAMAAARPVVTFARPDTPVITGTGGLAVAPGQPHALARAVLALCAAAHHRRALGLAGRAAMRNACLPS